MHDKKTQHPRNFHDERTGRDGTNAPIDGVESIDGSASGDHRAVGAGTFSLRRLRNHPLKWAVGLPRLFGVRVRIHLLFIMFVVTVIAREVWPLADHPVGGDPSFVGLGLGALLVVLMVRETVRLWISRSVGGSCPTIIIWPVGSLHPPCQTNRPMTDLLTTASAPLVNLTICLLLMPVLAMWITHDWSLVLFNPLDPVGAYSLWCVGGRPEWWAVSLWWVNEISLALFIVNMLPMLPLDGGRLLERAVTLLTDHRRSNEISSMTGYATAFVLAVVALAFRLDLLLVLAMIGAVAHWQRGRGYLHGRRTLIKSGTDTDLVMGDAELSSSSIFVATENRPLLFTRSKSDKNVRKSTDEATENAGSGFGVICEGEDFEAQLDLILMKIHDYGMDSLSEEERGFLEDARRRKMES